MSNSEIKKLLNKHFKEKFKITDNENEWEDSKKRVYLVLSDEEAEKEFETRILNNLISVGANSIIYSLSLNCEHEVFESLNKIHEKASDWANPFLKAIVETHGDIELIKQDCSRGEELSVYDDIEEEIGELSDGTKMFAYRIE